MRREINGLIAVVILLAISCDSAFALQSRRGRNRSLRNDAAVKAAFKEATLTATQSTVRVLVDDEPVGLGCVVTADGEILTKASLLKDGATSVRLPDGTTASVTRLGVHKAFDLILLKAESGTFKPIEFSDEAPGAGKFVAAPTEDGDILGVGLVTIDTKRAGLRRRGNRPERPTAYLGLMLEPAEGGGLTVAQEVARDAPVFRYGFRKGDRLITFDGYKVNAVNDLLRILAKHQPRDRIDVKVIRDGDEKSQAIRLGTRPGIDQWGGGPFSEERYNFPAVITHDIRIRPEECGGPLVSSSGAVVGINIARALRVATYAVPGEAIAGVLSALRPEETATTETSPPRTSNVPPPPETVVAPPALSMPTPDDAVNAERAAAAAPPTVSPIRAAGIDGSLLVYGDSVPEEAVARFLDLAKRENARIVVVESAHKQASVVALKDAWTESEGATFDRLAIQETSDANDATRLEVLDNATAIWFSPGLPANALVDTALAAKLAAAQKAKLAIAAPASLAAAVFVSDAKSDGISLLPDSLITTSGSAANLADAALKANPLLVSYHLNDDTALMIRGRYIFALGGSVEASFAPSAAWPDRRIRIAGRNLADLTALRRFASRRTGDLFPPAKAESPNVENGTLMIVGGGGVPRGLLDRFVEEAGGTESVICVIPISMPASQLGERDSMAELFRKLGAKEVHVLKQRTPAESDSPEVLEILRRTTGIWFGGGRQWRFIDAYEDTKAAELMHDVLKRGGVIGGSSAGASIQGDYMARGNPLGPRDIMADGYEAGLRFLKGVAIDQHFTQRNRLPDMTSLMERYPQLLGIGIDETTAIVVQENIAEVVGKNRVCFYDRRQPVPAEGPDYQAVEAGGKYDLVARKVLSAGEGE